jgi:hypothetical protein
MRDAIRQHRENQRVQKPDDVSTFSFVEVVLDTQHNDSAIHDEFVQHCRSSLPDVPMSDDPYFDFGTGGTISERSLASSTFRKDTALQVLDCLWI